MECGPRNVLTILYCAISIASCTPQSLASDSPAVKDGLEESNPLPQDDRYGDGGVSDFYQVAASLLGSPGQPVHIEEISSAQLPTSAGRGIRMLYSSTDGLGSGRVIAVSGQILFPKATAPAKGWPIVAWEHGTTGIADVCAPSWRGYLSRDRIYLNRWLDEGFAVVATDYQGLGTHGPHPYLLYRPEGYSVLDGLRAALLQYTDTLRNQIILIGQSQGSGAALGAAWLTSSYSPDLHVIGVVATGLVVQFVANPDAIHPPIPVSFDNPDQMDAAYAMLRVVGTDQSLHPEIEARNFMTRSGIALSHVARTTCLGELVKQAKDAGLSGHDLFTPALKQFEAGEMEASQIPDAKITVPVFVGTGLADYEASLPGQYNAVAAMCDAGTVVAWHLYTGLTHNGTVNSSLVDSVPFVRELMAGSPMSGTCKSISIPGPVEPATPGVPFNN